MRVKAAFRVLLAAGMIVMGTLHFLRPEEFVRIMPEYLPEPRLLVLASGFFEIAGGFGLLLPRTRRAAAWGLIALYVCVFPANVNMALHPPPEAGETLRLLLWLRLPLQPMLMAWAWWVGGGSRLKVEG